MFEVNFFEKKQKNVLPYVISGVFLFIVILVGLYFFFMQQYYTHAEERNLEWLQTEEKELVVSREIQTYEQLTNQVSANKGAFEAMQYPMAYVAKTILEQVPDAEKHVAIFNKNETNQITLVLEGLTATEVSETVAKLEKVDSISAVQFIRMENELGGEAGSLIELWIEMNEAVLEEVSDR